VALRWVSNSFEFLRTELVIDFRVFLLLYWHIPVIDFGKRVIDDPKLFQKIIFSGLIFGRYLALILSGTPTVLDYAFCGLLEAIQVNTEVVPRLGHSQFSLNPLQLEVFANHPPPASTYTIISVRHPQRRTDTARKHDTVALCPVVWGISTPQFSRYRFATTKSGRIATKILRNAFKNVGRLPTNYNLALNFSFASVV
jgi:hypothetical protein